MNDEHSCTFWYSVALQYDLIMVFSVHCKGIQHVNNMAVFDKPRTRGLNTSKLNLIHYEYPKQTAECLLCKCLQIYSIVEAVELQGSAPEADLYIIFVYI